MPIVQRLRKCLDEYQVKYTVLSHSRAYTAQEVAASVHVPGSQFAKTVVAKTSRGPMLLVLPAHHRVDVASLARERNDDVRMAHEAEFAGLFPECEVGAMPPFGNLYGLEVAVARPLTEDEDIVFNCGTHSDVVRMKYADFERIVRPKVGDWSVVARGGGPRELVE